MPPELALLRHPTPKADRPPTLSGEPKLPVLKHNGHDREVEAAPLSLIVHSGQRWIQAADRARPLLSRLSQYHPVLFVEPPLHAAVDHPLMQLSEPHPQVIRAVPLLPLRAPQERDSQRGVAAWLLDQVLQTDHPQAVESLVVGLPKGQWSDTNGSWHHSEAPSHASALRIARTLSQRFAAPVQWFGSPMEAPVLIGRFGCLGTVYDRACAMLHTDRWNPGFVDRDRALLRQADLVLFNGEPALQASRAAYLRHASPIDQDAVVTQAVRAAWDAKAALIRTRLVDLFGGRRRKALPMGFLAASAEAFGLQ
jgi:hypothetical protein